MKKVKAIETHYCGYLVRSKNTILPRKNKLNKKTDLSGKRYNRLMVIDLLGVYESGYNVWGCICDCGTKIAIRARELYRGHTQSCGCLNKELSAKRGGWNKGEYGNSCFNQLFYNYKRSAQKRGYDFNLTENEFRQLVESECYYCGSHRQTMATKAKGTLGEYYYTGIDRINNNIGYINGNVNPCCKQCNIAKGVLTESEFYNWVKRIHSNLCARFEHGENKKSSKKTKQ